mmetsp:Transcript_2206/g.4455  ORF Transcript_2206/g.4455 Transcript_2206/m.4455 type:complete len:1021 (-) Transcript_2206:1848-4910(-)
MRQDALDWSIFVILYVIAFVVLTPRRRRNQKAGSVLTPTGSTDSIGGGGKAIGHARSSSWSNRFRSDSFGSLNYDDMMMDSAGSSLNSLTGARLQQALQLENETDEERFVRVYDTLLTENHYTNLILPPTCKLIEKPIASELRQQQAAEEKTKQKEKMQREKASRESMKDDQDDPAKRLQLYFNNFMGLVRSLFTFDYAGAAWTILLWVFSIHQTRRSNSRERLLSTASTVSPRHSKNGDHEEPEEDSSGDDDDDEDDDGNNSESAEQADFLDDSENNSTDDAPRVGQHLQEKEEEENRTAATATSTAPPTPFATPMTDGKLMISTASVVDDSPRIPLLDQSSMSQKLHPILSPLVEEKKESHTPDGNADLAAPPLRETFISPRPLSYVEKSSLSIGQSSSEVQSPEALDEDSSVEYEMLPPEVVTGRIDREQRATSRDSNITLVTANQGLPEPNADPGDSTATPSATTDQKRSSKWYFFETAHTTESLKQMSLEVGLPDRNGYVLGDDYLPDDDRCTPLLVFVNSRSGPQQGHLLITQLRRLLNPIQIWDLANGPPEPILESFLVLSKLRILVCGGDGTVSWIISALDSLNLQQRKWPPIAILPLGTGNDLARVHGWGAGYNNESLISILEQISESYISVLDRWELSVEEEGRKKRVTSTKNFFNYFSVGVDAEAALQVHYLRERRPEWFFSRFINKAWYGVLSAEESIKGNSVNVRREIVLYADGVRVPLPHDSQGIIILNIDSYAGGVPLWSYGVSHGSTGHGSRIRRSQSMGPGMLLDRKQSIDRVDSSDDLMAKLSDEELFEKVTACDRQSSCQDGYLDIVSVRGLIHLGQCKVGIGNAQRIAQCRDIKIVIKKKVAVQIDGEPWRQDKCTLRIKRKKDPALMLHRSADDGGIETEMSKLLDWAEDRSLIDGQVHTLLMKEFSRRIETKTRHKRQGQNMIQNLKRAIGSTGAMSTAANTQRAAHRSHLQSYSMEEPLTRSQSNADEDRYRKTRSKSMLSLRGSNNIWTSNDVVAF